MAIETISTILSSVKNGVDLWDKIGTKNRKEQRAKLKAIDLVLAAVQQTRAYLYDKDVLLETDRSVERDLSKAWRKAGSAIRVFDEELFHSSQVKSLGWGDPREWEAWKQKAKTIDLDLIEKQCEWLRENET